MRLARFAGLTGAATLTSRVLGLVRDQVLAAVFGAGNEMDAFLVAFRIPNMVRDLFAEGAMSAAFIPSFTRHLTLRGKGAAWHLGNNVLNAIVSITVLLVVAGMVFAQPLVTLYAAGFAHVPGKIELTIQLARVVLPFLSMVAVAAVVMGMLNSLHHYFIPALSPAMFNVAIIVGALALTPLMPTLGWPPIMSVAIATLIGGVGQVVVQWPSLRREGFRYEPILQPSDPGLHEVAVLMGPGTIGMAATQVNVFVSTVLATAEGTGAVSWLAYAFRLMYLPIGLFGVSIGTAVLPAVSEHAASGNLSGVRTTISRGLAMMLLVNVPATVGLIVLARPIVELLFERGRFLPSDTAATAAAVRLYAIGLVGYSTARIITPTFYALRQSRTAVAVSVATIITNVILSLLFVTTLGFRGLALATSIAALLHGGVLVILLARSLNGIDLARLGTVFARVCVSAGVMGVAAWFLHTFLLRIVPGPLFLKRLVPLGAAIAGALVVMAGTAKLLRIEEIDDALGAVRTRVPDVVRSGAR